MLWRKITFLGTASGRMAAMAGPVTWVGVLVTLYKVFFVTQPKTIRRPPPPLYYLLYVLFLLFIYYKVHTSNNATPVV